MLVLGRKKNERIMVEVGGELIIITLVDFSRERARIGIDASKKVIIHREEVWNAITEHTEAERRLPDGCGEGGEQADPRWRRPPGCDQQHEAQGLDGTKLPGDPGTDGPVDDRTN